MRIQHNISALNSHRNLGINNSQTSKNLEKLSSGFRINRAGDDAAGLAISEKMRGQIRGLAMAEQNTSMGINLIQTAEGGLNETHAILQRMRELAVQSSNGTFQDVDRTQLGHEFEALKEEIDRIAESTHYNGIKLLNGNLAGGKAEGVLDAELALIGDIKFGSAGSVTLQDGDALTIDLLYTDNSAGTAPADVDTYTASISVNGTAGTSFTGTLGADGDTLTFIDQETGISFQASLAALKGATTAGEAQITADYTGKGTGLVFQIGANGGEDQRVTLNVNDMACKSIGVFAGDVLSDGRVAATTTMLDLASIANITDANEAIDIIDGATNMVSAQRAKLGALQNRLEHTMNNLGVTKENLTASESTIRDVDMAAEMMEFTKNNILVQASQAMLAQANQLPQGVLQLLR